MKLCSLRAAMRVGATFGYLDVVFSGKHIFNVYSKKDTFIVEGVSADLRHYIPTLARLGRCFPWKKWENRQAVLTVFIQAYNRFSRHKTFTAPSIIYLFSLSPSLISFNSPFGDSSPAGSSKLTKNSNREIMNTYKFYRTGSFGKSKSGKMTCFIWR